MNTTTKVLFGLACLAMAGEAMLAVKVIRPTERRQTIVNAFSIAFLLAWIISYALE